MALLQPRLNLKVAQKQVLTPGLVQMVSLLALNKQELKEMIDAEILENPVLEELEDSAPLTEEARAQEEAAPATETEEKQEHDPFDEIDFGSYFQDYLDPGYRTPQSSEISEKPSFENFLSKPTTLTDHLMWQLGSLHITDGIREAAELIIGNLDEDGYLSATEDELLAALLSVPSSSFSSNGDSQAPDVPIVLNGHSASKFGLLNGNGFHSTAISNGTAASNGFSVHRAGESAATLRRDLAEAHQVVRGLDPVGIAARDLRECLLTQLDVRAQEADALNSTLHLVAAAQSDEEIPTDRTRANEARRDAAEVMAVARRIIDEFLPLLQKRDIRELAKLTGSQQPRVQQAIDTIRALDPRPGQRYHREEARLIEPDVAFVKREEEYVILINDEELPTLRLNQGYRRMLTQDGTEREVRDYVKERYRSAIQLMRNIEQRKNTILRTCEVIVRRQKDFLEEGVDSLKPMMIKDVAEEIGVHASTVSRAVANKYAHTPQGVFELRFFFSEGVNGPEGADTPLLLLKRKVKKMIEDEDSSKPLTDDAIARALQSGGIAVNRRTVAKYREDMGIPSTHQRRVRI